MELRVEKHVNTLPGTLTKNTVYLVKVGSRIDMYTTNDVPTIVSYPVGLSLKSETSNITKNTNYPITATRKIISVTVFNPSDGRLIPVEPILAADRLSGNIKILKDINNAEISIITE